MAELLLPGAPTRVYLGENTVLARMMAQQAKTYSLDAAGHAADAALSSATAESAAGPTYPDTATGLAATTDGQSFAVDNGDGTITIYLNDAGVADAQRTLATTAALAADGGASLVGWIRNATGAFSRSIADWFEDELSVMDFIPLIERVKVRLRTSTADLSTAFQRATDAAAARGGAEVKVPSGRYYLQGVTLKQGVTYRGDGQGATVLCLPDSPTSHMFSAEAGSSFDGGGFFNIQMDGGQSKATAVYDGIDFSSVSQLLEYHVEGCYIHHFRRGFNGSWGGGPGDDRSPFIRFSRFRENTVGIYTNEHAMVIATDCGANDIGMDGRINDLMCVMCKFTYNRIGVSSVGNPHSNAYYSTCQFFANSEYGLRLGENCSVTNTMFCGVNDPNALGGLGDCGILVYSDNNYIHGNRFGQFVSSTNFGGAGILVQKSNPNALFNLHVEGNNFLLLGAGVGIKTDHPTQSLYGLVLQNNTGRSNGKPFAVLEIVFNLQVRGNNFDYRAALPAGEAWLSWTSLRGESLISENRIWSISALATGHLLAGPETTGSGYATQITNNSARNFTAGPFAIVGDSGSMRYSNNNGFVTKNSGELTLGSGATVRTVTHGLSRTPSRKNITVVGINAAFANLNVFISNVTDTTFDVVATSAPASSASFAWQASAETI